MKRRNCLCIGIVFLAVSSGTGVQAQSFFEVPGNVGVARLSSAYDQVQSLDLLGAIETYEEISVLFLGTMTADIARRGMTISRMQFEMGEHQRELSNRPAIGINAAFQTLLMDITELENENLMSPEEARYWIAVVETLNPQD